jgi:hypothetical protein
MVDSFHLTYVHDHFGTRYGQIATLERHAAVRRIGVSEPTAAIRARARFPSPRTLSPDSKYLALLAPTLAQAHNDGQWKMASFYVECSFPVIPLDMRRMRVELPPSSAKFESRLFGGIQ